MADTAERGSQAKLVCVSPLRDHRRHSHSPLPSPSRRNHAPMEDACFEPDLIHSIFKLVWSKKPGRNEVIEIMDVAEVGVGASKKSRPTIGYCYHLLPPATIVWCLSPLPPVTAAIAIGALSTNPMLLVATATVFGHCLHRLLPHPSLPPPVSCHIVRSVSTCPDLVSTCCPISAKLFCWKLGLVSTCPDLVST
ncbi:hypothetical protein Taro_018659 [Colocasia esculenta]|uniref:Uncharacterized protein n=1 Tax=Colocasia esculenta TaxID=4460 RepID=A0A843UWW0_COLES|nr:hypothetical protein [Colocasia esculenta]